MVSERGGGSQCRAQLGRGKLAGHRGAAWRAATAPPPRLQSHRHTAIQWPVGSSAAYLKQLTPETWGLLIVAVTFSTQTSREEFTLQGPKDGF